MWQFERVRNIAESFRLFQQAAARGHEESMWILEVLEDVEIEWSAWKDAFAKTEKPLGFYFAGHYSYDEERSDLIKKSAEGGCSWGQVLYAFFFDDDEEPYFEWMEKAAKQSNPCAMDELGHWWLNVIESDDIEKAFSYFRASVGLGWSLSAHTLARAFQQGEGCEQDLRQAAIFSLKAKNAVLFNDMLNSVQEEGAKDCDVIQLCYTLGSGMYWYFYKSEQWDKFDDKGRVFGERCLDFYCSCVELQQKSIFTFLLCWNRTTGVKGPGQIIAQMVWEERADNLTKAFEENDGDEAEMKKIKK
jgi:TPR repeat protein